MFWLPLLFATSFVCSSVQNPSAQETTDTSPVQFLDNTTLVGFPNNHSLLAQFCGFSPAQALNWARNFTFRHVYKTEVAFYIYNSSSNHILVNSNNISGYLTQRKTVVLIHGWNSDRQASYIRVMADAYIAVGGYNIVVVDWPGPAFKTYCESARSVQGVGKIMGRFIHNVVQIHPEVLPNLHLVGHSLGAHSAGFAGRAFHGFTGIKLPWITAQEPAGLLFDRLGVLNKQLNKDDAVFVDAVHTDVGLLGTIQTCGQVDFFVHCGGPIQSACVDRTNTALVSTFITAVTCSHLISCSYYAKTIEDRDAYMGYKCKTCPLLLLKPTPDKPEAMGEGVNKSARGVYCVPVS